LNSRNLWLTLEDRVEIRQQSALDEAKPKEKTPAVLQYTAGLGLIEAGIKLFEDNDWNEQLAGTTEQGVVRLFA
jgi:hypothetical protein